MNSKYKVNFPLVVDASAFYSDYPSLITAD